MSSGTRSNPYAPTAIINSGIGTAVAQGGTDYQDMRASPWGMTDRQVELERCWSFYRCSNYDHRKMDWNGQPHLSHIEHNQIATEGYVPPGFVDVGQKLLPIKFRRPTIPFYLAKIVVDRFTGLLFGEGRTPEILVEGDPLTQDYVSALCKAGRFWATWTRARAYGGAMGSACVSFKLVKGRPVFETHDPRWCFPRFSDRSNTRLVALEKRYVYPREVRDPITGQVVTGWFWYRRVITAMEDVVWEDVPVAEDREPAWDSLEPKARVASKARVLPVVWVQNQHVDDSIDGDPDCHGAYDTIEGHDALMSQGYKGIIRNCDPTPVIASDDEFSELPKGSDVAIQTEKGGSVSYLELAGSGPKAAREMATELRDLVYEMTACVPEDGQEGPSMTAFEVAARMSRMVERCDSLRDQYGDAIVRLLQAALQVVRAETAPTPEAAPGEGASGAPRPVRIVEGTVHLPPRFDPETRALIPRRLGPGGDLALEWPRYFTPTLDDVGKAVTAATTALTAGAIDAEVAANFLKQYLPIQDVKAMLARAKKEHDAAVAQANAGIMGAINKGTGSV